MAPTSTGSEEFEHLAAEALDGLPDWVRGRLDNVEVVIEDGPPDDAPNLLGLYEGIPLTERGIDYTWALPDRITLYRSTIEAVAGSDPEELKGVVADTVIHEVAHFFGISDERLEELGRD
jgi:predicted Zn-dependent protease with MMP-like domain